MADRVYKRGLTYGVFDLIHTGHINLLQRARGLCDYLIVGVQDDEGVMKMKPRPILTTRERVELVRSLKIADEVIVYHESTEPSDFDLKFDVYIHGEDWAEQTDRNRVMAYFKEKGVDLVLLPRTSGISTSEIIRRIKEQR
jgi:glycerol-3-phosphate cytidylyltransferase